MKLPKFVIKQMATHNFDARPIAHISRYGQNIKPRTFIVAPTELYMNGADSFGERHIVIEETSLITGAVVNKWMAVVGNGKCYQV